MLRKEPPVPASNPLFITQITISTIPKAVRNVSVDVWFVLTRYASISPLAHTARCAGLDPRADCSASPHGGALCGSSPYKDGETYSSKGKVPCHATPRHAMPCHATPRHT
jgi:hypothetical protein